jgi:signal peptidase II
VSAHTRLFTLVVTISVFIDQVTKYMARDAMKLRERIEVIPGFFNLTHQENPGAAWGILGDHEYRLVFFTVVTLIAFAVIIGYFRKLKDDEHVLAWGLCLIFAGAAGNFIDRMSPRHTVTDFLDFYASGAAAPLARKVLGSAHWPAFNAADAYISVGVTLFVIHILFLEGRSQPDAEAGDEPASTEDVVADTGKDPATTP